MNNKQLSKLIHNVADGDMDALKDIWYEMQRGVTSFALMHLNNRELAEDVTQETFIRIIRSAGTFTHDTNPRAWILTIAKNIAVSMIRKYTREVEYGDYLSELSDGSNIEDKMSESSYLASLLIRLTETERKIMVLHVVSGMKHHEIAGLLELPLGTVYRTYSQSIKKLRQFEKSLKAKEATLLHDM